jgi:accessory gene regulator protein AgrB
VKIVLGEEKKKKKKKKATISLWILFTIVAGHIK